MTGGYLSQEMGGGLSKEVTFAQRPSKREEEENRAAGTKVLGWKQVWHIPGPARRPCG